MPTYVYAVVLPDGSLGERFEVVQAMRDPPLDSHPDTGAPVRRLPQAPMVGGRHSSAADRRRTSDSNLDRLGFTKYRKVGDGRYEKTAGRGPRSISSD